MDDRDIRALLDKYRPAGPPAALRTRVAQTIDALTNPIHEAGNSPTQQLTWPWAVAAAGLLAVAIVFHVTSRGPSDRVLEQIHNQRVDDVAAALGGSSADRLLAETLVAEQERADSEAELQRRRSELMRQ